LSISLPEVCSPGIFRRRSRGPCDAAVDFIAKQIKIDGLRQECLGAAFQDFSPVSASP
jgi:hypothetical protein